MGKGDDLVHEMNEKIQVMLDQLPLTEEERQLAQAWAGELIGRVQELHEHYAQAAEAFDGEKISVSPLTDTAALALAFIQQDYALRIEQIAREDRL